MARLSKKYTLLFVLGVFMTLGCEVPDQPLLNDYAYFPLELGRFQTYTVSESNYSVSSQEIIKKYELKERISEVLVDTETRKVFKLERLKRANSSQNWQIDSVMKVEWLPNAILKTENNISFMKLVFPIETTMKWNQNTYNTLPKTDLVSTRLKNIKVGTKNYNDVVSVVERNDSSAISKVKRYEVYAPKVGLIYKENTTLEYCQSTPSCIGKGIIEAGIIRIMTLESYGVER